MTSRFRGSSHTLCAALLLTTATALCGCGGSGSKLPVGESTTPAKRTSGASTLFVAGHAVTTVPERTIGPAFARRGDSGKGDAAGLVAWVTVAEGQGRRVVVVPVDGHGRPRGAEHTVALVPIDTTMIVARTMRGNSPGFVVAWTSLTERGESLWSVTIGDDGLPRSKATELQRTGDDIVWVDVVPTDHGAVCVWAEETRSGDANVVAAALEPDGKVRGVASRIVRGVVGWRAIEMPSGVGVATIAARDAKATKSDDARGPGFPGETRSAGPLSFLRLDADGHPQGTPTLLGPKPLLTGDVTLARTDRRTLFGWTDRSTEEAAVMLAALDDDGKIEPARRAVERRGGAALLGLAGAKNGSAAVLFESPARGGEVRHGHVALVDPSLSTRRPASFEFVGAKARPELAATKGGFASLAPVRDCDADTPACLDAPVVATVLRVDEGGSFVQREPLAFQADPASAGWDLSCEGESCFALTASPGQEARIRAVEIRQRANAAAAKAEARVASVTGPRVTDVTALVSGESVFDFATANVGDTPLLAMLGSRSDAARRAEDGGSRGATATLTTRILDKDGGAKVPSILSTRALVVGGVAIAAAEKPEDGGAVAWVARENGDPEVHVTRIDKNGRRTNDVQLTTTKGDATDVAIAWAGGGFLVAWIDGRDGNGEVYATKVSLDLQRTAREERITNAPGDASDLVAVGRGENVWLAWSDPRESPHEGLGDIYVTAVKKRDAKRAVDEQRILSTASHSRTPQLVDGPEGLLLAWIEEAPHGSQTPSASGYGALWTTLDDKGKAVAKPSRIALGGEGAATSVALERGAAGVRAVVARSTHEAIALDAIELHPQAAKAAPLLMLDGPPSLDVALLVRDDVLFFNDEGPTAADRRARRAKIAWPAAP